jgi:hypothetical protein
MPKLSELTDAYTPQEAASALPVEQPYLGVTPDADGMRRVVIDTTPKNPEAEQPGFFSNVNDILKKFTNYDRQFTEDVLMFPKRAYEHTDELRKGLQNILGGNTGEDRYQLWPERMVKEGVTAAGKVASGEVPQWAIDPATGDVHTSPQMIEKAQEISALAGTGGLASISTDATLGSTPFLRPALKYKDKLYKGKDGQQHLDVIPESVYPEFQQKAMSGQDINEFKFGFVNDKGHFLDREAALRYGIDTGLVDPQAGKFGALTSTLMADSSKPGIAIEAMKTAQPFFSAVEHNVNAIPQAKMTGDQWLGTLGNKPGVKPEELQWTGLKDFLEENKGKPVTKEQIQEHLQNNKVELKEISKGELSDKDILAQSKIRQEDWDKMSQSQKEVIRTNFPTEKTKYHDYQLPGGENYREMLLTLPQTPKAAAAKAELDQLQAPIRMSDSRYVEASSRLRGSEYRSSHWDEPNILAHVRMNDRTIDGKKSLHLEEIQSDWHQQGRDKGYAGKKPTDEEVKTISSALSKEFNRIEKANPTLRPDELTPVLNADPAYARARDAALELNSRNKGVPDAPFKKSWHELALKRMIREAAEKGYDRLSWTPGEAQAARYDLSKSISDLSYNPRTKTLIANDKNGATVMQQKGVEPEKISDFVGKDVAKKLMSTEYDSSNPYSMHSLTNADLRIGGEGMKGFYDQIIPKALEKLGKEHGVKVKQTQIIAPMKKMGDSGEQPIHYIDIPQSLRDQAMHKGFPLFSAGGHMLVPVQGNPFENEKKK